MKKILMFIFCSLIIFNSFSQVNSNELVENENFKLYSNSVFNFISTLNNNFNSNQLKELEQFFKDAQTNNLTTEEQFQLVTEKLNLPNTKIFIDYSQSIQKSIIGLKEEFGDEFNKINSDTFNIAFSKLAQQSLGAIGIDCAHPWQFSFCVGGKAFQGTIMMNGCLAMVGVSAGTLTPAGIACLAGVSVWLANEMNDCKNKYCNNQ